MKTIKAFLALLFASFLLLGLAQPASAAKPGPGPAPSGPVIILDSAATQFPLAAVADDWSARTGVSVFSVPCVGEFCIHFSDVAQPCPGAAGPISLILGCAYRLADGSCQVDIAPEAYETANRLLYVVKHEVGHCIWSFSGNQSISYHLPGDRALMSAGAEGYPSRQETRLTSEDRHYTASLF